MWVAMLVLAGILNGGVISFARNRRWLPAIVLAGAAALSFAAAMAWLPKQGCADEPQRRGAGLR
ncbi:MAG: hypothetical protein AB7V23_09870, partial [Candidatus Nanopelagicales bacterium]